MYKEGTHNNKSVQRRPVAFLKRWVRKYWPSFSNECIVLELRDQMLL